MFEKILIANRGEIACRIARTARRLGVRTVAVYSDADAQALHTSTADEAVWIGPAAAAASYLAIDRIIAAAVSTGAQAVHPGYGFLSENADFADACAAAGLAFIGPRADAIRVMGSKSAAKALMAKYAVPLVPGYYGDEQDGDRLLAQAEAIGFPVLIKASAGGGGRGMRVVAAAATFAAALASAQREAQSAFGDARMLIEKYIENPRHIEVQVFGDTHGNVVHLFERDCSLQRRHQKVIEEAPAIGLTPEQREHLFTAALAAARAVDYVGAGTVEFVIDGAGASYFIEMNTRLQVEHPVTEMITGLDLVEWQLRVAAGEALPLTQAQIVQRGHALEVRIYAEDPAKDFRPSVGRLAHLRFPAADAAIRIDSGIIAGDTVTSHYDAMIAKLVTAGADRPAALRLMSRALEGTEIAGVSANVAYLHNIIRHPAYLAGDFTTHFVDEHRASLIAPPAAPGEQVLAVAAAYLVRSLQAAAACAGAAGSDPTSPWHDASGFRLNGAHTMAYRLQTEDAEFSIRVTPARNALAVEAESRTTLVSSAELAGTRLTAVIGGRLLAATLIADGAKLDVFLDGRHYQLRAMDPLHAVEAAEAAVGSLTAPMPGAITAVLVALGQKVQRGAPLIVLEAMKMEHTITAPCDGVVSEIHYAQGEQVAAEGVVLVRLEPTVAAS